MFMQFQPAAETVREDFADAGRNLGKSLLHQITGASEDLHYLAQPRFDWRD